MRTVARFTAISKSNSRLTRGSLVFMRAVLRRTMDAARNSGSARLSIGIRMGMIRASGGTCVRG